MSNGFFSKIKRRSIKLIYRIFHFGFFVTFFDYLFEITKSVKLSKIKHKIIVKWIRRKYNNFVSERFCQANIPPQGSIPKKIWVCWWDGIDKMPPLVTACYESIIHNSNGYHVILITKFNYTEYFTVPDYIIKKINNGKLTLTHFSDIMRMALLYNNGGLWLDITYLVTSPILIQELPFFTIRTYYNSPKHIANGRWQGNCVGGIQNNFYFKFIYDLLCEYWKEFDYLLTYHIYDYFINLANESFPVVKTSFDIINPINKNDFLVNNLKNEFNSISYEEAIKDTIFHKLSWKRIGPIKLPNNKLTFYGYIVRNIIKEKPE